ncbi:MAG TPA: hypothetical protein VJ719_14050 [Chthoniobacterales bacterium]|nr:hypothetical protein [Chthoniobacterales bacterium]
MRLNRLVSLACSTCFLVAVAADLNLASDPPNVASPDGAWIVQIGQQPESGGQQVRLRSQAGNETVLWKSPRWLEASWSPSSDYLAVTDHLDGHQAAVLIFMLDEGTFKLVFQTPLDPDIQAEWSLQKWNLRDREVLLRRRTERIAGAPNSQESRYKDSNYTFPLGSVPIRQNLYRE